MNRDDEVGAAIFVFVALLAALLIAIGTSCVSRCTSHPYDPKCIVTACPDVDAGS